MVEDPVSCPTCGRPYDDEHSADPVQKTSLHQKTSLQWRGFVKPAAVGAAVGLFMGTAFVAWWFKGWSQLVEAHTIAGFTHEMALIHEIAGTALGILGGLIYGALKRRA